jgi:hypothetical protein
MYTVSWDGRSTASVALPATSVIWLRTQASERIKPAGRAGYFGTGGLDCLLTIKAGETIIVSGAALPAQASARLERKKSARVPAERRHMTRAADGPDDGDPRRRSASSALAHASVLRCTRRRAASRRSRDSAPARESASPAGPNHAGEAVRVHARRAPPRHSTETCESWPGSAAKHAARRGGRQLRRMREKSKTPSYVIAWDRHTK